MKDCLIIGFPTALTYKDIYPLLRDKILTVTERSVNFYEDTHVKGNWYTTLPRSVECSNKSNIPVDYQGKIGVPISFFYYYPELPYEILEKRGDLVLNGKRLFERLIIRRK